MLFNDAVHLLLLYGVGDTRVNQCGLILAGEGHGTQRKPCPSVTLFTINHTWTSPRTRRGLSALRGVQVIASRGPVADDNDCTCLLLHTDHYQHHQSRQWTQYTTLPDCWAGTEPAASNGSRVCLYPRCRLLNMQGKVVLYGTQRETKTQGWTE